MVISLLKKMLKGGNKQLLEDKASQIKKGLMKHASLSDILRALNKFEQEYNAQTPENPKEMPLSYIFLRGVFYNPDIEQEIYKDDKGSLYTSVSNFKLKYSNWSKPFVALPLT